MPEDDEFYYWAFQEEVGEDAAEAIRGEFLESRYGGSLRAMLDDAIDIRGQIENILNPDERESRDRVRCCIGYSMRNGVDTFEDTYEAGVPVDDILA